MTAATRDSSHTSIKLTSLALIPHRLFPHSKRTGPTDKFSGLGAYIQLIQSVPSKQTFVKHASINARQACEYNSHSFIVKTIRLSKKAALRSVLRSACAPATTHQTMRPPHLIIRDTSTLMSPVWSGVSAASPPVADVHHSTAPQSLPRLTIAPLPPHRLTIPPRAPTTWAPARVTSGRSGGDCRLGRHLSARAASVPG